MLERERQRQPVTLSRKGKSRRAFMAGAGFLGAGVVAINVAPQLAADLDAAADAIDNGLSPKKMESVVYTQQFKEISRRRSASIAIGAMSDAVEVGFNVAGRAGMLYGVGLVAREVFREDDVVDL